MIERLHHAAYRCQDSEATRSFYEDFLGLPLTDAFVISQTQTGRKTSVLHLFFGLPDGSSIAFFEAPDQDKFTRISVDDHAGDDVSPAHSYEVWDRI